LRLFRAPPGGWSFTDDHSKLLGEMRLIRKSAPERNVAQGPIRLKHVLGGQFDAAPDHEGVG
jgi:hypothetical protein